MDLPPQTDDSWFVQWENDWFCPHSDDDMRTNRFVVSTRQGSVVYSIDYSMLTDFKNNKRSDEVTALLFYSPGPLTIGVGYKWRGDFGGEGLQNWWHKTTEGLQYDVPYEQSSNTPILCIQYQAVRQDGVVRPEVICSSLGGQDEASFSATFRLNFVGDRDSSWLGATTRANRNGSSNTAANVAVYESGVSLIGGFTLDDVFTFGMEFNLKEEAGTGSLTITF